MKMRHDAHYVESLTSERFKTFGRYINVGDIEPNPEQPRVDVGDLTELSASIADKGVLEPLLVRPVAGANKWMIIAGERRWRAACAAGLEQVPCIEMAVDDQTVAEIALIENLQRKDLTVWEEADALQALAEKFGYTHAEVAKKIGKSRTTVTETLALASVPHAIREQCRMHDISSKALLLQIIRQPTDEHIQGAINDLAKKRAHQQQVQGLRERLVDKERAFDKPPVLTKPAKYTLPNGEAGFVLQIKFDKDAVTHDEVAAALRFALDNINTGKLVPGINA
jgi:ParB family chromosome partitioning protein